MHSIRRRDFAILQDYCDTVLRFLLSTLTPSFQFFTARTRYSLRLGQITLIIFITVHGSVGGTRIASVGDAGRSITLVSALKQAGTVETVRLGRRVSLTRTSSRSSRMGALKFL